MKNGIKFIFAISAAVFTMASCSKLNSGESFNQTINGVEYNFEVIVSRLSFVRISPVQGPSVVKGSISIPDSGEYEGVTYTVTQIKEKAFKNYTGITSVKLPASLSQIEKEAFAGCTSLVEINTPQPLAVIGEYAFDGCVALENFSLDASISELGEGAFRNCIKLGTLEFTPTFSEIPDYFCQGCTSIEAVELPTTILSIGKNAFEDCVNVQEIKMDRSVQTIGSRAFYNCTNVQSIRCLAGDPPVCSDDTFGFIDSGIPVTVPKVRIGDYQKSTGWNRFTNFVGTN